MKPYGIIQDEMLAMADEAEAVNLMRFFKTGPGEYGEGDRFLGIRVPATRALVRKYRRDVEIDDVYPLVKSDYHEIRLAGFLLLIEIYERSRRRGDEASLREIVRYYLSVIDCGNNWDLVDLVSYKLLGPWLADHPEEREILDRLAGMGGHLWHQRVAIVTTMAMIKRGEYDDTLRIARKLLDHPHDLIHKAVGWMLREVGKRGGRDRLNDFLDAYAPRMPRTMLRYAIEHFTPDERARYMTMKQSTHRDDAQDFS